MKKVLLVSICMLMALFSMNADPLISGSGKLADINTETIDVTFDLGDGEDSESSWKIGLTSDVSTLKEENVTDLTSVVLGLQDDNTGKPDGNVYLYWIIKGGQKLKIALNAEGALSGGSGKTIDWTTSWTSVGDSTSSSNSGSVQSLGGIPSQDTPVIEKEAYTAKKIVFDRTVPTKSVEIGNAALTIVTENVEEKFPASYSSNLTVSVSPAQ